MSRIKDFIASIQFMTSIPVPVKTDYNNLKRSLKYFPVTGMITGLLLYFLKCFLTDIFNDNIITVLQILFYAILTRGLHLDGMMDTVDGFFSYKPRERILEIMKESTTGSFAIISCVIWGLFLFQVYGN